MKYFSFIIKSAFSLPNPKNNTIFGVRKNKGLFTTQLFYV